MVSGKAQLLPQTDPLQAEMRWRIIRQYHETEAAARRYAEQIRDQVSALIIVTPENILSQDFN